MRNWITTLLLIPMCLLTMGGTTKSSNKDIAAPFEEVVLDTTESTTEETVILTTPPTEVDTEATEVTTEPTVVETEPPVTTEPEETEAELVYIGTFGLTAYCGCVECCGEYAYNRPIDESGNVIVIGSIGVQLEAGVSIAVDPRVIPYGTRVVINGHTYIAQDTGGKIKGNRIDIYFESHQEAWDFGMQNAEVFIYV